MNFTLRSNHASYATLALNEDNKLDDEEGDAPQNPPPLNILRLLNSDNDDDTL